MGSYTSILLSIIVPAYNAEKYIQRCLDSILKAIKNHVDKIEVIVVNDGSLDHTKEVLKSYIERQDILYIEQENSGVSVARNTALQQANGHFISFVDADDYIDEEYIEKLFPLLKNEPEMICFDLYRTDGKKNILHLNCKTERMKLNQHAGIYDYLLGDLQDRMTGGVLNKIYRKDIIENNHIQFLKGKSYAEDLVFNAYYLQHITNVQFLGQALYYYFYNEASVTHSYNPTFVDSIVGFIPDILRLCQKYSVEIEDDRITKMILNRWFGVLSNQVRCDSFKEGYRKFVQYLNNPYFKKHLPHVPNSTLTKKQIVFKYLTIFHLASFVYVVVYVLKRRGIVK